MENKFLIQLLEKLNTDSEFLDEFLRKDTVDKKYEFATNAISGYTKEEFIEMLKSLKKLQNKDFSPSDEISDNKNINNVNLDDESLDNVVGGSCIGIAAAGAYGFLAGGGSNLIKKLSEKINKKDRDKKYNEYKKQHNLTDDDIVEMLVNEKTAESSKEYRQNLIDEFKKSL